MKDYKQEIANTRVGCIGSSDAKMLTQIARLGYVPKSAHKRLAVVKGLIPNEEIPRTGAVAAGDYIEMEIYKHLAEGNPNYESNPMWVSEEYSKDNVKLISHPDIVLEDPLRKTIYVYEVKTTKKSVAETKETYKEQIFIHSVLARERAAKLGRKWMSHVYLVHYSTDGLNLESEPFEFDVNRLSIHECKPRTLFDVGRAMDIVSEFLDGFNEYFSDEINEVYLPDKVRNEFKAFLTTMREIKEREKTIEAFKAKLYDFLVEKDIKSIVGEEFMFTRVDETESHAFDSKKFLEKYEQEFPRKYRRLIAEYDKVTKRKGYAKITLK